ncbi:cytochrome c [Aestuariivirga litoralis]|uniref:cytochrome c n=1 Tax=Aestuariivirga litoralis TaxID=2650924 RepID=UPI0018C815BF|nr:cytochrome c [Aestuariivirga litoralis]MBG1232787.1 c-type cytochrome [Aestuariivirga litoralis]
MKRTLPALAVLILLGLGFFWWITSPQPFAADDIPEHVANLENGKLIFHAGGCMSCHAPGADLKDVAADVPAGGKPLVTPIGTLYPPNLTPDPETGLGKWSDADFVNAVQRGLSPSNAHLIPAFPYTSYAHMKVEDVLDLKAYLASLPPVVNKVPEEPFPAILRRGIGAWKWVSFDSTLWKPDPAQSESWNRGSYLVNGPGHCQECHTPRNLFMGLNSSKAFAGGPHPEGKGKVPSLRSLVEREKYKDAADLVLAFQNGETLGYEHMSSGGMGDVQSNLSKLPDADLTAIADYLLSLK